MRFGLLTAVAFLFCPMQSRSRPNHDGKSLLQIEKFCGLVFPGFLFLAVPLQGPTSREDQNLPTLYEIVSGNALWLQKRFQHKDIFERCRAVGSSPKISTSEPIECIQ